MIARMHGLGAPRLAFGLRRARASREREQVQAERRKAAILDKDSFHTLFERLPIGAYRSSWEGQQLRANAALVRLNGYQTEAEMLANIRDIGTEWYCDPQRRGEFARLLREHGQVVDFVSEVYRHKTRERIWVREHAHQVCDARGRICYFEGTVQDITEEHQHQRDLHASERRFRAMTELSSDWYWELDAMGHFVRLDIGSRGINPGASEEVLGKTRQQLTQIDLSASQWATYQGMLDRRETFYDFEMAIHGDNSRLLWHAISGAPIFDSAGVFVGYRGIGRDVTRRRESEALIRHMAFHDVLTGLANRRLFMDRLQQALNGMARTGSCAVLMFLDLDSFKSLNDRHGHAAGDSLLQQVGQRLAGCVRSVDTVARLGGDEFTILMQALDADGARAMRHARTAADKVMQALTKDFDLGGETAPLRYACSVSLGVVILRDPLASADVCIQRADAAMYRAKGKGRGGVCIDADAPG